jgi:septum formation protein
VSEKTVLLLASNSPRRQQLLSLSGWAFNVVVANVDETPLPDETPQAYVLRLAEAKARAVEAYARPGQVIIAADTAVIDGMSILGKPSDLAEAESMLRRLRGRIHQVYTALAVLDPADGRMFTDVCITQVPMRAYSDDEIYAYVMSGDPLDKAGGYAIQHPRFQPVEQLEGCFASVMGLPLCHLVRMLKLMNISPTTDVALACQVELNYQCPVSRRILAGEQVG